MISLCMIVKNEERFIAKAIESVKDFVHEIIIVDTGSTDKTIEIAKKYTSKIFNFKWTDNFSTARNFSIEQATQPWILVLDADETIDKTYQEKLTDVIKNSPPDIMGISIT
ncbi:glycosyltransferase family 2 protein, partial [Candidatus Woesearchaeota archaeon]|nr:glycosyltransferase family 2 protein [Candidatus Woesearchaeota archaeon]